MPEVQGGIEKHCQELYPRLVKMGVAVTLLARKGYVPARSFEYGGVLVMPLAVPRSKKFETLVHTLFGFFWLARYRRRFDVVHVHGVGPALFTPLFRLLGFKVVVTSHGPDYRRRKWRLWARIGLILGERLGVRYANAVIAVAGHIQAQLRRQYGREVFTIPNGAALPPPAGDTSLLADLKLKPGRYILAVGRFVPEKGFHKLLAAFARLDTDRQLVIAGSALHEDGYTRSLRQRGRETKGVVLPGFLPSDRLAVLYGHAGLFVLPSSHEGMSLSLLEALAYGLPVLASDIPANREVDLPEERYFRCGDEEDLLRKMERLLVKGISDSERETNRRMIEEKYNWDRIAEETVEVYEKVRNEC